MSTPTHPSPVQTTQARHPWRSTIRTAVAFVVGVAPLAPSLYEAATQHNPELATGIAGTSLAICASVTRLLALPVVERGLRRYKITSWLAAAPAAKS